MTDTQHSDNRFPRAQHPQDVAAAIRAAARSQVPGALEGLISGYHPIDIAFAMRELEPQEREVLFRLLDSTEAGVILEEVDDEISADLAEATAEAELAEIIDAMPPDAGSDMVSQLDEQTAHRVLERIPDEESEELRGLLQFGPETAGGIMTPEVLQAPPDLTPADVIAHLRSQKLTPEVLTYVYIVDEASRHLLGVLSIPELITAPPDLPLGEAMVADVVTVHPDTDREDVVRLVDKYDLMALPIVDKQNRLLGVVTIDDVIDAIQEEHTEDITRVGGTSAEALASGSSFRIARLRLPWLIICLAGTFVSATVIRLFTSSLLGPLIALAAFIPVINAMSGNSGLQSSTITVRGLALGLISRRGIWRLLARELLTAVALGLACGTLAGLGAGLLTGEMAYAPIIGASLCCAILWASMLGTIMPLVFDRLNIDPALASGPLVTTFNDSFSLLIYFGLSLLLINVVGLG